MKKGAVIGISVGAAALALNILVIGLFGTYLSKAKAASSAVRSHNSEVSYLSGDTYMGAASGATNSIAGKGDTYGLSSSFDYAPEEAEYFENDVTTSGSPDITETNIDPEQGRLLIRTVSITAETTNYSEVASGLENKVKELGGYIEYSSMSGTGMNRNLRTGSYTVRVPAEKLDELINSVSGSCTVTSSSEGTTDVTLEYVDTKSRVDSLRVEYNQLMELLKQAEDLDTIILLQNRLTEIRYQIESAESRIRVLENQVQFATLNFTLREVLEEKEVEEAHVVTYGERVMDQFEDMWEGTVEFFQNLLLGLIALIPLLVFMGIVTVIVLVIVFSARKKRRKKIAARKAKEEEAKKAEEKKAEEKKAEEKKTEEKKPDEKKEADKEE